ncbi:MULTISPECIES: glyoxalase [Bizionia]|uniref:Glyoxalase n=1 Tax=Bizionia algoritergicola TaxID=291187 RepID=A0A5D0QYT3_9FLAO|nr:MULTISPECIES: glyoxalase [Bizionia]OBX24109.1 glyoxalase [Bizionia sp. APA-3]TYB73618.1 glyoxalase [Bizionia algoritergicola]
MNRSEQLLASRPEIPSAKFHDAMSPDERFQNTTLRPVIKLQNDLLIEVFKNYANKHKGVFYDLSIEKQMDYIENAIQKDIKFRNALKGIIIGQFTVDEYQFYITNSSALNKRMMNIVKERLISNIQLFETQLA